MDVAVSSAGEVVRAVPGAGRVIGGAVVTRTTVGGGRGKVKVLVVVMLLCVVMGRTRGLDVKITLLPRPDPPLKDIGAESDAAPVLVMTREGPVIWMEEGEDMFVRRKEEGLGLVEPEYTLTPPRVSVFVFVPVVVEVVVAAVVVVMLLLPAVRKVVLLPLLLPPFYYNYYYYYTHIITTVLPPILCEICRHCRPQNSNLQNWNHQSYGDFSHIFAIVCSQIHVIIHPTIKKNTVKHNHYHYP